MRDGGDSVRTNPARLYSCRWNLSAGHEVQSQGPPAGHERHVASLEYHQFRSSVNTRDELFVPGAKDAEYWAAIPVAMIIAKDAPALLESGKSPILREEKEAQQDWEMMVTSHVAETCTPELQAVCSQVYTSLSNLIEKAGQAGMDQDEVL